MIKSIRLLISACASVVALALLAGTALGLRSIEIANPGGIRATGARITFEDVSTMQRTVCQGLTLNGTISERIAKREGSHVGSITEGASRECLLAEFIAAEVTVQAAPASPFEIVYHSILGTLPSITGILLIMRNVAVRIRASARTCEYAGNVGFLFRVEVGSIEQGGFLAESMPLIRESEGGRCPVSATIRGRLRSERARAVTLL